MQPPVTSNICHWWMSILCHSKTSVIWWRLRCSCPIANYTRSRLPASSVSHAAAISVERRCMLYCGWFTTASKSFSKKILLTYLPTYLYLASGDRLAPLHRSLTTDFGSRVNLPVLLNKTSLKILTATKMNPFVMSFIYEYSVKQRLMSVLCRQCDL